MISSATESIVSRSRPYSRSPMSDSPESLSSIRWNSDAVAADPVRLQRGDVHRDLARQVRGSPANLEEDADLVSRWMRVRRDETAVHGLETRCTRDDDVLAEPPRQLRPLFLELSLGSGPV